MALSLDGTTGISATGNIWGNNIIVPGTLTVGTFTPAILSTSGNITGNYILGNGSQLTGIDATSIQSGTSNVRVISSGGNVTTGIGGTPDVVVVATTGQYVTGISSTSGNVIGGNLQTAGNILSSGLISASSNVIGGNLQTAGNILSSGLISTTGNVNSVNVIATNLTGTLTTAAQTNITLLGTLSSLSVTGNVQGGNLRTVGLISAAGNVQAGNVIAGSNVSAANIDTSGQISAAGNITGNYIFGNGSQLTGIDATSIQNGTANVRTFANGNVTTSAAGTANVLVVTSTGTITTGSASATGTIVGGNLVTTGTVSATGTITGANITGANFLTAGLVSATGAITGANITGANFLTAGLISATGNVTANNVVVSGNIYDATTMSIVTGSGDIQITPASGNIVLPGTLAYINNVAQPVQNQDAATKLYVDNMASTQLTYHTAVAAATTANLATTTGGTVTYNQPGGAGNGIGATITTTGSFNLIDTANVQTANTRILVKDEGNAVLNGVYVWSNATVITRSNDADSYGANSITDLSINDYFFVTGGNVNKGSAWICDGPSGTITFGTSNISFAQFSSSQTYTAGNGITLAGTVITAKTDGTTTAFDGGGNIIVKASANLTTPNIGAATGTSLSTTGNITGGNILTAGLISATGNVTGGNILFGAGIVSGTGNVFATNLTGTLQTAAQPNITSVGTLTSLNSGTISSSGNVTGANLRTAGSLVTATISATGNVFIDGYLSSAGMTVFAPGLLVGGYIKNGSANGVGNIGESATVWNTLFIKDVLATGLVSAVGNTIAGNILTAGLISCAGALITGGDHSLTGNIVDTGTLWINTNANGNINLNVNGTGQTNIPTGILSVTSNIVGGNLLTAGIMSSTGNGIYGNVLTGGLISATGNATAGNVLTSGLITATGNVTGGNILTGGLISATSTITSAANVTGGNITTAGLITATGNIQAGNLRTTGLISATSTITSAANITGGNILTAGIMSSTGNAIHGNILYGAGIVSGTGNVFATNLTGTLQTAAQTNITSVGTLSALTVTANVTGGNILTAGVISATGRITTASDLYAYTLQVGQAGGTGDISAVGALFAGGNITTNSLQVQLGNNAATGAAITGGGLYLGPRGSAMTSWTYNNGTGYWATSGASIGVSATGNVVGANVNSSGSISATGSITGGNILTGGLISATSTITSAANVVGGNITTAGFITATGNVTGGNILTGGIVSATSNIVLTGSLVHTASMTLTSSAANANIALTPTGTGVIIANKDIINGQANGVGNIGNATGYFNTIFAKATSAQYADLAEKYVADAAYEPGTVLKFGGEQEVTMATEFDDTRVAGVVSTNPSYLMNATQSGVHVVDIALQGRVPCKVRGPVSKGDLMVSAGSGHACANNQARAGTILGKSLQDFTGEFGTIEIAVGRD